MRRPKIIIKLKSWFLKIIKRRTNYWIARMSNLDDEWLEKVRTKGECMFVAEYRYGKNEAGMEGKERGRKRADIKRFLKAVKDVKQGDVFFFTMYDPENKNRSFIHAYGIVKKCQRKSEQVAVLADVIESRQAANFSRGIVLFKDSDVFYENLEENNNWGQRIDVDDWHCYVEDTSVTTEGLKPIHAIRQNTLFMIDSNDGESIKNALEEQYGTRRI